MTDANPAVPLGPGAVRDVVDGAVKEIDRAIQIGALKNDPLLPVLQAFRLSLGAQLALHEHGTDYLQAVRTGLDEAVSSSLVRAARELEAKEAAVVSKLAPKIAEATDRSIRSRLWTIKVRTVALSAGGAVVLGLGCYAAGWIAGRSTSFRTGATIVTAAGRDGPDAAATWSSLIANNDVQFAMAECRKAIVEQAGRRACPLPVWLDPPLPPSGIVRP